MRDFPSSTRQGQLVESLKDFLTAQSKASDEMRQCSKCGSVLRYLPMEFWLEGSECSWNIRLPYCSDCHPVPVTKETFAA